MTVDDRVQRHYEQLDIDPNSVTRLHALIDTIAAEHHVTPVQHPARRRVVLAGAAALAVAAITVASLALATPRSTTSNAGRPQPAGPGSSTTDRPSSHVPSGFIRAVQHDGTVGLIKKSDLNDLNPNPDNLAQALRQRFARGRARHGPGDSVQASIPFYAGDGTTILGTWKASGSGSRITCPNTDGIALSLTPPRTDHGAATPIQAARTLKQHDGFGSFGGPETTWTVTSRTRRAAQLTSGLITMRAIRQPDDTWVINRAQRCNS